MKLFFQILKNLFAGLLGKLLIAANFIICLFIFDWNKLIRYLETPARINCHIKEYSRGIDICTSSIFPSIIEPILFLLVVVFLILVYPSIAVTEIVLEILKAQFPLWCIETFDILFIPVFAVINSFYWLFLGDMIEMAHSAYLQNRQPEKPLSCFPNSE